ncbi:MAG: homoserine/homoserine lactone efflux protein [Burkholderiaceae bacterium]
MTLSTWLTFCVASWLISLSPGAGAISCMSAGMRYGFRRSIPNVFGLQVGATLLIIIVAAGLGAVLATSVPAFTAIKWFGVAYLLWLGIAQWRAKTAPLQLDDVAASSKMQMFTRAVLINLSNPKGIVFMLAVLPQFIDPHAPQWSQYALCAATIFVTDAFVMSGYTLLAARVFATLREPHHIQWMNRTFGSLFVGAALLLATIKRGAP